MKIWKSIACLTVMLSSVSVIATEEDTPFASLQWTFGSETMKPDVVIGYRSVDVETDGDVSGWQGSVSYKPHHGLDKVKVEAVTGDENMQATYGGGYSLQQKQALLTAGVNGSYLAAGADFLISHHTIEPYVGITTLHSYDVPEKVVDTSSVDTSTVDTSVASGETYVPNNHLQEEYFPEYTDCSC